jgi:hypothetical protein
MTGFPQMIRNVAVVGHLHHGKTALMDMLVFETHKLVWDADQSVCEAFMQLLKTANSCFGRHGILTLMCCLVNGIYRSNHHQCRLFYQLRLANRTWFILLTHQGMSISLTRLHHLCGWSMALF